MTIAVDFDGTLVTHRFPMIGLEAPGAVDYLKKFQEGPGNKIILYTMRGDNQYYNPVSKKCEKITPELRRIGCKSVLQEAIDWCTTRGIKLYAVNTNPSQYGWTSSKKVYANMYIDDTSCNSPMTIHPDSGEPVIDWTVVEQKINEYKYGGQ